jgi:hypothetical protein
MPSKPPIEIKAVIDKARDAFNSKNAANFESAFSGDVVIVVYVVRTFWTS